MKNKFLLLQITETKNNFHSKKIFEIHRDPSYNDFVMQEKKKREGFLNNIRCNLSKLTDKEKNAASYLLRKPDEVSESVISEFADSSGVSDGTIVRLAKKLGYDGFASLKKELRKYTAEEKNDFTHSDISESDDFRDIVYKVIQSSIQVLKDTEKFISNTDGERAIEVLSEASLIRFYGLGEANSATKVAMDKFSRIGLQVQAPSDPDAQLITASLLEEDDAAFAISHSGRSKPTVNALKAAKKSGANTLCITNTPGSPITEYSDIELYTAAPPSISVEAEVVARRISEFAILEALFLGILYRNPGDYLESLKRSAYIASQNKL